MSYRIGNKTYKCVLVLCMANKGRSPSIEQYLTYALQRDSRKDLDELGIMIRSTGALRSFKKTLALGNIYRSSTMARLLKERGIKDQEKYGDYNILETQSSIPIGKKMLSQADLIILADKHVKKELMERKLLKPSYEDKILCLAVKDVYAPPGKKKEYESGILCGTPEAYNRGLDNIITNIENNLVKIKKKLGIK